MLEDFVIFSFARKCSDAFWQESFWLPCNLTWADFKATEGKSYPEAKHLSVIVPLTVVFFILRYVLEKHVFLPIGKYLNVDNKKVHKVVPNKILEEVYGRKEQIKYKRITALAKQLDWSERKVERWLRRRYSQDKPKTLRKFCESGWRWVYYTYSFSYGLYCLWDKPWLWDIQACWHNYPRQHIATECWWYYMSSATFYTTLLISQFFDVRRKDYKQMCVHHMVTLTLIILSWICNHLRVGTLVILVHDTADALLDAAKLAKYANYQRLCNVLFVVFTIAWIVTRLGFYPFWLLYTTSAQGPEVLLSPPYYIFNTMLYLLQILHLYWTYIIFKIVFKFMEVGNAESDLRSSTSNATSESTDERDAKSKLTQRKKQSIRMQ